VKSVLGFESLSLANGHDIGLRSADASLGHDRRYGGTVRSLRILFSGAPSHEGLPARAGRADFFLAADIDKAAGNFAAEAKAAG